MARPPKSSVSRASDARAYSLSGRVTSKGQVTIPSSLRKHYGISEGAKLEFLANSEGILLRPTVEAGSFKELAGSASKCWTAQEMLQRLEELRNENV